MFTTSAIYVAGVLTSLALAARENERFRFIGSAFLYQADVTHALLWPVAALEYAANQILWRADQAVSFVRRK